MFLLSCFVLDSRLRTRQPEGARPRARGSAEAQRQGAPGRAYPGAAPREVGLVDYVSYLICSVSDTIESRLVPADPFPIRLVGSSLTGTRKRWRRRRPRRRSRRRPAPPVPPRTTRTRVAARSRRHQHARRNLCTIIDAYLRIFVDAMFVGS